MRKIQLSVCTVYIYAPNTLTRCQSLIYAFIVFPRADLKCTENKGVAEDVLGALDATIKLKWSSENKVIFQIADAPHHGKVS